LVVAEHRRSRWRVADGAQRQRQEGADYCGSHKGNDGSDAQTVFNISYAHNFHSFLVLALFEASSLRTQFQPFIDVPSENFAPRYKKMAVMFLVLSMDCPDLADG
jgi:hypothetical protein